MQHWSVLLITSPDVGWTDLEQALRERQDVAIVGETTRAAQARAHRPDAILCAATVEGACALPLLAELHTVVCPDSKLVVFAPRFDPDHAAAIHELDLGGYALWGELTTEVLRADLPAILRRGHGYYTATPLAALQAVGRHGARRGGPPDAPGGGDEPTLTEREREMLRLAEQGKKAPEIGAALAMEASSVRKKFSKLYEKIGVADRTAAVAWAKDRGEI
jgi:DNA-binding NarL/FixJ family response regulator